MAWNCEQIEERLSEYLDGQLGGTERRAFAAHAEGCRKCAALTASVGGVMKRVQALEEVEAPVRLVHAILDATLGPRVTKSAWRAFVERMRPALQLRFAMGAVTVALTMVILSQALGIHPTKITWSDLNPMNVYHAADRKANLVYARGVKFVNDLRVVNEIQSRLQPEAEPPRPTEAAPAATPPATTEPKQEEKGPKQPKSADEPRKNLSVLAVMVSGLPGRSH